MRALQLMVCSLVVPLLTAQTPVRWKLQRSLVSPLSEAPKPFRVNAVDHLLKPLKKEDLAAALSRVAKSAVVRDHARLALHEEPTRPVAPIKRFLIRYGGHFKVVEPDQIAYIHSLQKNTFLRTKEGRDLPLEESLDKLELQLDPEKFIRLNRQLIVQLHSIKEWLAYS